MRNYIQTDTVRISAIYLRTGGTPEIAHYATEWMVTVIPFITSSGEVGKKRGFTSKLGYLYPSSSLFHHIKGAGKNRNTFLFFILGPGG